MGISVVAVVFLIYQFTTCNDCSNCSNCPTDLSGFLHNQGYPYERGPLWLLKVIEVETPMISATEKNLWANFADELVALMQGTISS